MKKIILAPNSFKECADSVEISNCLSAELRTKIECEIIEKPLSDGGDGFLCVCERLFDTIRLTYNIKNTYDDQLISVPVLYSKKNQVLIIESAEIVGLKKIPKQFRYPLILNTTGVGELIKCLSDDVKNGILNARQLLIGIGGTATVDFGLGAASFFGLKLLDNANNELKVLPVNFINAESIFIPKIELPFKIKAIADVNTPLFGKHNAIEMYSVQKGADSNQVKQLINGFIKIYNLLKNKSLTDFIETTNGAGGGLASGLKIFFHAELISGTDFIEREILNDLELHTFDAVITGEGSFDRQSFEQKGAHIILEKFKGFKTPIFIVCGSFDDNVSKQLPDNMRIIELQKFFSSREDSVKNYRIGLKKAAEEIANHLKI